MFLPQYGVGATRSDLTAPHTRCRIPRDLGADLTARSWHSLGDPCRQPGPLLRRQPASTSFVAETRQTPGAFAGFACYDMERCQYVIRIGRWYQW
jgi:hypothetical protein